MISGNLIKMAIQADAQAQYTLRLSESTIALNPLINQTISLKFGGRIFCTHCGKITKKSYSQGYCYPCSMKLAACDLCIMQPERCHFSAGTCREPDWAQQNCFQPHYVYLANSAGLKVGITRFSQVPTRWLDQGAEQALPIYQVKNRYLSGLMEVAIKAFLNDKTDWRKMLKNTAEPIDLIAIRDDLYPKILATETQLQQQFGDDSVLRLIDQTSQNFAYPVNVYPNKVTSLSFDKTPEISETLLGIKGQYLIFPDKVLNLRKHTGYEISFGALS